MAVGSEIGSPLGPAKTGRRLWNVAMLQALGGTANVGMNALGSWRTLLLCCFVVVNLLCCRDGESEMEVGELALELGVRGQPRSNSKLA